MSAVRAIVENSPLRVLWALAALIAVFACQRDSGGPQGHASLFRESAEESGLSFRHFNGARGEFYLPEIMAPGVALLDYDLDGDLDVYLLQATLLDPATDSGSEAPAPGALRGNRLFENRIKPDGVLKFVDSTEGSGLGIETYAMGVAVGDYDGDRDPDIYLTSVGPNHLLRNEGNGTFRSVDGPQDTRWSTSATFTDYDRDGDLDLFFTNFVDFSPQNNRQCFSPTGERDYCVPTVYSPVPDRLFRNEGLRFSDVTAAAGLDRAFGNGLGVIAADLNLDGWVDLYVANDTMENQLWMNSRDGRFADLALQAGAAVNADGMVEAGMGIAAADFDADGDDDLLMTHNAQETNTLYLNNGGGLFLDSTNRLGLGNSSLPYTGFGVAWEDFDHDGALDVFIANGAVAIMEDQRGSGFPFVQENLFYKGRSEGFATLAGREAWGSVAAQVSRGLATGDVDLDGDTDIVVTNCNGPARLYLNQSAATNWLRISLSGASGNPRGIGARVGVCWEKGNCRWRRVHRDGSYLSSSEPAAHFTLPNPAAPRYVEVRWPGGEKEQFAPPPAGQVTTLRQGSGSLVE